MSGIQTDMSVFFQNKTGDNPVQMGLRNQYCTLYWTLDNITTNAGAEKSVAKRKLLESMDAALRAAD